MWCFKCEEHKQKFKRGDKPDVYVCVRMHVQRWTPGQRGPRSGLDVTNDTVSVYVDPQAVGWGDVDQVML